MTQEQLALSGGKRTFQKKLEESWKRPKEVEKKLVSYLIDSDELSGSGYGISKEFEDAFAAYIGCKYCLTFSHGTAALMAAYFAAGVGPGDEVITPAVGFIASYAGAMHLGARPVFCDIDPLSLLIDPVCIRKNITTRTKAINIVHLNGRVCNLDEILQISKEFDIAIIDDASHAHGAEWDGQKLGNFDHITCFSLQGCNPGGKAVSGGEGGVACTNNPHYYQRMLAYCQLHRKDITKLLENSPYQELDREVLGLKWRAHPLALAVAGVSLSSLNYRNDKRFEHYQRVIECFKEFEFIRIPKAAEKARMGGFFGGLKFVYESASLGNIPIELFIRALQAEGVPLNGPWLGHLEYRRALFTQGFDLWGRGRGPLNGPWAGLDRFNEISASDFPVAENISPKTFNLFSYIEVDDIYYTWLAEAFHKLQKYHKTLIT